MPSEVTQQTQALFGSAARNAQFPCYEGYSSCLIREGYKAFPPSVCNRDSWMYYPGWEMHPLADVTVVPHAWDQSRSTALLVMPRVPTGR